MRFNRFEEIHAYPKVVGKPSTMIYRIRLKDFWLKWSEIARRAKFDFDYLTTLQPLEMRFYELTKLLRFKDTQMSLKKQKQAPLEIIYRDFCLLMPVSEEKTLEKAEKQIEALCIPMVESGFLKDFTILRRDKRLSISKSKVRVNNKIKSK